jgi:UDP-2,3-diacylglucosamine pyrophosphatase LpxH
MILLAAKDECRKQNGANANMSTIARDVYVISDLHLGGEPEPNNRGFRLCTHESELAAFIESLCRLPGTPRELVLNGDTFDFLAEKASDRKPFWRPFRYPEEPAVDCLNTIARRCAHIFEVLTAYLKRGNRLVILPGNHDIELNLPAVRNRLKALVGASQEANYEFIGGGEAYRVGDVLIEHGDRLDDMNFVDYNSLRRLCALLSRGMAVSDEQLFDPPAGSELVAQVINDIKVTYRFIDLLKPEKEAAFPLILALEPGRRAMLASIARSYREAKARRKQQLHSYRSNVSALPDTPLAADSRPSELDEILIRTVGRADFAVPPPGLYVSGAVRDISWLDKAGSFATLLTARSEQPWENRVYDLLDALRAFQGANAFDRTVESEAVYQEEADHLAYGPIRHIVFGHTHLARQIPLANAGFYFNSGTWADLLELPSDVLDPTRKFGPLATLEQFVRDLVENDFSSYTQMFRPTFVRFGQNENGSSLTHELCDYHG